MQAKVTVPFDGARDGEIYPTHFKIGDKVEGNLALVAVREKWAKEVKQKVAPPSGPLEIPNGWSELEEAELLKLARDLGAPAEVETRDAAAAFVQAEVERRAAAAA